MVHLFEKLNRNFMIDVESGRIFELDRTAYLAAKRLFETLTTLEDEEYSNCGGIEKDEAEAEIHGLVKEKVLDTKFKPEKFKPDLNIVKSLCLNVSHDCNLQCKYCFADGGKYQSTKGNMSFVTAQNAVDFLIERSKNRQNLDIDFFGGEPLLNFEVVKNTVDYAVKQAKLKNKTFKFTMTTNGALLDDEKIKYLNETMFNIVISIDGRRNVHNSIRPSKNGKDYYDKLIQDSLKVQAARKALKKDYYIRGTFTTQNLDFSKDVLMLNDAGFEQLSLEPVVLPASDNLMFSTLHLPALKQEYRTLAREYILRRNKTGKWFNFFHFNFSSDAAPCLKKRLTGCGAGTEYLAVAANGDIYPCHQFVGDKNYLMGNVNAGTATDKKQAKFFGSVSINSKPDCQKCWAKYYCSGGCNANAVHLSGDVNKPVKLLCELMRERIECAIAIDNVEKLLSGSQTK